MDLILWRHADAEDAVEGQDDLSRCLTKKGERQAARMGKWLDHYLPESARIMVSPALRARLTATALGRKYKLRDELAPSSSTDDVLEMLKWDPEQGIPSKVPLVLVGHQPYLGGVVARLLSAQTEYYTVRKGAAWWLRLGQRNGELHVSILGATSPELL
jgi:phosphohistidine phosphatase